MHETNCHRQHKQQDPKDAKRERPHIVEPLPESQRPRKDGPGGN
ncbi:hypothetical protein [Anaerostipes sp.]|nr:hypothetical protein [Anaerostipes sp.]